MLLRVIVMLKVVRVSFIDKMIILIFFLGIVNRWSINWKMENKVFNLFLYFRLFFYFIIVMMVM